MNPFGYHLTNLLLHAANAVAAIEAAGATPVFVDVEPDTGNLDCVLLEQVSLPASAPSWWSTCTAIPPTWGSALR